MKDDAQPSAEVQADARKAAGYLSASNRLSDTARGLQCELVAQWLAEPDRERRERCWHECRALEAVTSRLVSDLDFTLGAAVDTDAHVTAHDASLVDRLTDSLWQGAERWLPAVSRWKHG
jgi:hypothetical protein